MPVWTIGHSSAELDRLFALLRQQHIDVLVELARGQLVCILCSEEDPAECHRGNLISPTLVSLGVPVVHIRHDGTTESQQDTELRQSSGRFRPDESGLHLPYGLPPHALRR